MNRLWSRLKRWWLGRQNLIPRVDPGVFAQTFLEESIFMQELVDARTMAKTLLETTQGDAPAISPDAQVDSGELTNFINQLKKLRKHYQKPAKDSNPQHTRIFFCIGNALEILSLMFGRSKTPRPYALLVVAYFLDLTFQKKGAAALSPTNDPDVWESGDGRWRVRTVQPPIRESLAQLGMEREPRKFYDLYALAQDGTEIFVLRRGNIGLEIQPVLNGEVAL